MSAANKRRSMPEILAALQTALQAATWSPAGGYRPAIADPADLADPVLVDHPGGTISDGHAYSYAISFLTTEGETALSNTVSLLTTMPMDDKALRLSLPAVAEPRITGIHIWRNYQDSEGPQRLLATVAPGTAYYDDPLSLADFDALNTSAALPAGNTTAITAPQAAFQSVKLFDTADLPAAFTELMENQQRVCFIVPDLEQFEAVLSGSTKLQVRRRLPVALLISDRVTGNRLAALYGAAATDKLPAIAGAEPLKEIALAAVTGQLINGEPGKGNVLCSPTTSTVLTVEDAKRKLPGRACIELDLECSGGTLEAATGPGPTL